MRGQGSAEAFLVNSNTSSFHEIQVKTIRAKGSGSESHFRISTYRSSKNANFVSLGTKCFS